MGHYERDLDGKEPDRRSSSAASSLNFSFTNEILQQAVSQRQDRQSFESAAQFSYTHIFSADVLGDFRAMLRDITAGFWSNDLSTPMIVSQDRGYREGYVKGAVSAHRGAHEFKVGAEGDFAGLQESLGIICSDPRNSIPRDTLSFQYFGHAPDREQGTCSRRI